MNQTTYTTTTTGTELQAAKMREAKPETKPATTDCTTPYKEHADNCPCATCNQPTAKPSVFTYQEKSTRAACELLRLEFQRKLKKLAKFETVWLRISTTTCQVQLIGQAKSSRKSTDMEDCQIVLDVETDSSIQGERWLEISYMGKLAKLLGKIDSGYVVVSIIDDRLEIQSGVSVFTFDSNGKELTSLYQVLEWEASTFLESDRFSQAVKETAYATCTDNMRYSLGGIQTELTTDSVCFVGCDSHRLVWDEFAAPTVGNHSESIPAISYRLAANLASMGATVGIAITESRYQFTGDGWQIIGATLEGKYPKWRDIVPESIDQVITYDREELLKAVETAAIMSEKSDNPKENRSGEVVDITPSEFETVLECGLPGSRSNVPVKSNRMLVNPETIMCESFQLLPAYVIDYLKCADNPDVHIGFQNRFDAVLFQSENCASSIVMPCDGHAKPKKKP